MSDATVESSWDIIIYQHSERSVPDRAREFLAEGYVAHIGFEQEGQPYVIPMLYQYSIERPDRLYIHGGLTSWLIRHLASGVPVCATVTELDGLVYSRGARYHSANYRCVMCFGHAQLVEDDELKQAVFQEMTSRYFPGRTAEKDYAIAPKSHLDATPLLEIVIEQISAKMREGGPKGPRDADQKASGTCGVVELRGQPGAKGKGSVSQ
jgi:nitroimidazol reductase NimA-like FMN-containing flavoprotein (pyridoxamine 5'-phosphate oxidase superfamily)